MFDLLNYNFVRKRITYPIKIRLRRKIRHASIGRYKKIVVINSRKKSRLNSNPSKNIPRIEAASVSINFIHKYQPEKMRLIPSTISGIIKNVLAHLVYATFMIFSWRSSGRFLWVIFSARARSLIMNISF